jgi:hypothetical protein
MTGLRQLVLLGMCVDWADCALVGKEGVLMIMVSSPNRATARGQAPIASTRDQVRRCPGRDRPEAKRRFRPDMVSTRVGSDPTTCTPSRMRRPWSPLHLRPTGQVQPAAQGAVQTVPRSITMSWMPRSDDGKPRGDSDPADPGLRRNGIRVRQPGRWSGARYAFRSATEPDECSAARSWRR